MTQQPPPQSPQFPQSPQPPEGAPEQTAALWYEQTQPQPPFSSFPPPDQQTPVDPQTPAEPRPAVLTQPGVEPAQPAKPRRVAELVTEMATTLGDTAAAVTDQLGAEASACTTGAAAVVALDPACAAGAAVSSM